MDEEAKKDPANDVDDKASPEQQKSDDKNQTEDKQLDEQHEETG